jgi:hypothetical protein
MKLMSFAHRLPKPFHAFFVSARCGINEVLGLASQVTAEILVNVNARTCRQLLGWNHVVSNRQKEKMAHADISGTRTKSVLSDPGLSHRTLYRAPNLSSPF